MAYDGRLRVGLIGCGFISARHGPAWLASPDAELVAVCDQELPKAERRAAEWGVSGIYADAEQMLDRERLDAVDIATRPGTHTLLVGMAAARGVQILCQKPLAPTLEEAAAMVATCDQAGVRFMVNEMWRYLPPMAAMGRLIRAGALGPVHYLRFVWGRQALRTPHQVFSDQPYFAAMPKLIVYEAMIHTIDAARSLAGDIETVYARLARVSSGIRGEDMALVVLGHAGGATSSHDASWVTPGGAPGEAAYAWRVEGGDATLDYSSGTGELRLIDAKEARVLEHYPDWATPHQQAFTACIGHFAHAVRCDEPFWSPARDNLRTLAAALASYDSAAGGQAVRPPTIPA
ncbi:MAG TPA: Gfo/Idh/MocA family oxidoreductase [Chloroflexota bacterium]|jgi:predicted dehydrogenase|nr:Gfo/Idh/MocA family oxidoreductase [Chloroflexota bacterium]